ncbi:hypothetical protein QJS10_CPB13g00842 [Acorus calamus]|uniref:RNase H type-1 domain-containing protein n=1 Tax=Acorus calamus TaxID=4465 RepID=A0AAV9DHI0_ACOCL|nr:hypothetical protein QJS10_CPB13g00842 [Acorus calamus]
MEVAWQPPLEGWYKSNSDGSLVEDRAGYGVLVRNCEGQSLYAVASSLKDSVCTKSWYPLHPRLK